MTTTIICYPSDDLARTVITPPSSNATVVLDFTNTLDSGDSVASATWTLSGTFSGAVTINSSANTSTTSTAVFGNSMQTGQTAATSCLVQTANGKQIRRGVQFVSESL